MGWMENFQSGIKRHSCLDRGPSDHRKRTKYDDEAAEDCGEHETPAVVHEVIWVLIIMHLAIQSRTCKTRR